MAPQTVQEHVDKATALAGEAKAAAREQRFEFAMRKMEKCVELLGAAVLIAGDVAQAASVRAGVPQESDSQLLGEPLFGSTD